MLSQANTAAVAIDVTAAAHASAPLQQPNTGAAPAPVDLNDELADEDLYGLADPDFIAGLTQRGAAEPFSSAAAAPAATAAAPVSGALEASPTSNQSLAASSPTKSYSSHDHADAAAAAAPSLLAPNAKLSEQEKEEKQQEPTAPPGEDDDDDAIRKGEEGDESHDQQARHGLEQHHEELDEDRSPPQAEPPHDHYCTRCACPYAVHPVLPRRGCNRCVRSYHAVCISEVVRGPELAEEYVRGDRPFTCLIMRYDSCTNRIEAREQLPQDKIQARWDDFCYFCKQSAGELSCCGKCVRVFHEQCMLKHCPPALRLQTRPPCLCMDIRLPRCSLRHAPRQLASLLVSPPSSICAASAAGDLLDDKSDAAMEEATAAGAAPAVVPTTASVTVPAATVVEETSSLASTKTGAAFFQRVALESDSSMTDLLTYTRAVSDHVIRSGPAWNELFPGSLITEWQPEEYRYRCPFALMWLYDQETARRRNDNADLSVWQKRMPLLPVWTVGVVGIGDCIPISAMLAVPAPAGSADVTTLWSAMQGLQRDPVFGVPGLPRKVTELCDSYRAALLRNGESLDGARDSAASPSPVLSARLRAQMKQTSTPLSVFDIAPLLEHHHACEVHMAVFDHQDVTWQSNRCFPGGILITDSEATPRRTPLALPEPQPDSSPVTCAADAACTPTMLLLQNALPSGRAGITAGTCGHVQPLFPAPDYMLCGPQHPAYPMHPTMWIPFVARPNCSHFLTPYHHGLFRTETSTANLSQDCTPSDARKPLFAEESGQAFRSTVHIGSVVTYSEQSGQIKQGAVALTYVRLSKSGNSMFREAYEIPEDSTLAGPLEQTLQGKAPVAMLALVPLQPKGATTLHDETCWQGFEVDADLVFIRTSQVVRVWHPKHTGPIGRSVPMDTKSRRPSTLQHRSGVGLEDVDELPNPAAPTLLRRIIEGGRIQKELVQFMQRSEPVSQLAGVDGPANTALFLAWIRSTASLRFPIDTLLCARARINCALPLTQPGLLQLHRIDQHQLHHKDSSSEEDALEAPTKRRAAGRPRQRHNLSGQRAQSSRSGSKGKPHSKGSKSPTQPASGSTVKSDRRAGRKSSRGSKVSSASGGHDDTDSQLAREQLLQIKAQHVKPTRSAAAAAAAVAPTSTSVCDQNLEDNSGVVQEGEFEAMRATFDAASDLYGRPEHDAPLASYIYLQWESSKEVFVDRPSFQKVLHEWQEYVYDQLPYSDPELWQQLLDCTRQNTSFADIVAKSTWRKKLHAAHQQPKAEVKIEGALWCYNGGKRPAAHFGSVWQMHQAGSNTWYKQQHQAPSHTAKVHVAPPASSVSNSKRRSRADQPDQAPEAASGNKRQRLKQQQRPIPIGTAAAPVTVASDPIVKEETTIDIDLALEVVTSEVVHPATATGRKRKHRSGAVAAIASAAAASVPASGACASAASYMDVENDPDVAAKEKEVAALEQAAAAMQAHKAKRLEQLEQRRLAAEAIVQDSAVTAKTADTAITALVLASAQQRQQQSEQPPQQQQQQQPQKQQQPQQQQQQQQQQQRQLQLLDEQQQQQRQQSPSHLPAPSDSNSLVLSILHQQQQQMGVLADIQRQAGRREAVMWNVLQQQQQQRQQSQHHHPPHQYYQQQRSHAQQLDHEQYISLADAATLQEDVSDDDVGQHQGHGGFSPGPRGAAVILQSTGNRSQRRRTFPLPEGFVNAAGSAFVASPGGHGGVHATTDFLQRRR